MPTSSPENLIDEEEILVAIIKGFHIGTQALPTLHRIADQLCRIHPYDGIPLLLGHGFVVALQHGFGDILHPLQETDAQSPVREFLAPVHGPESVLQVVVLDAAVTLDISVSAVMVGKEQSFVGNDLPGAATAEQDDRVLFFAGMESIAKFYEYYDD